MCGSSAIPAASIAESCSARNAARADLGDQHEIFYEIRFCGLRSGLTLRKCSYSRWHEHFKICHLLGSRAWQCEGATCYCGRAHDHIAPVVRALQLQDVAAELRDLRNCQAGFRPGLISHMNIQTNVLCRTNLKIPNGIALELITNRRDAELHSHLMNSKPKR